MGAGGGWSPSNHFWRLKVVLQLSISNQMIFFQCIYYSSFYKQRIVEKKYIVPTSLFT